MSNLDISRVIATGHSPERTPARAQPESASSPKPENTQPPTEPKELDRAQLEHVVERLRTAAATHQPNLTFSLDEDSGRAVVMVVDDRTGEVVRQVPSEQALRAAQRIADDAAGALLDLVA